MCRTHKLAIPRGFSGKSARKRLWILGFTLIEILVVVVIVGIAMSIAVANLFVSPEERVRQEAQRLMLLIESTRDRAAFSGYPIAMKLTDTGIAFLERDPASVTPTWRDATSNGLQPRAWRDDVRVSSVVFEKSDANAPASSASAPDTAGSLGTSDVTDEPIVTFVPTGISEPFRLRVFSAHRTTTGAQTTTAHARVIEGDALGNVRLLP
jgi:type II secretion system protein H